MIPSLFNGTISPSACVAGTFSYPTIAGIEFLSVEANLVTNLSVNNPLYPNHGLLNVTDASFCNVSTIYTHSGTDDSVNVQVWLPTDAWNGRLQAIGGCGWSAGLPQFEYAPSGMAAAVSQGYATHATDAGLGQRSSATTPAAWGLLEEGVANKHLLENLASTSLYEAAVIGKNFTAAFYKEPAAYSYFTGCSGGGRQGMMLAQRYPDAFDGIASAAPVINWNNFIVGGIYPNLLMNRWKVYPPRCEIEALTRAVIKACDGIDGVIDGIITDTDKCHFDPVVMVGKTIPCPDFVNNPNDTQWEGPRRANHTRLWYGPAKDTLVSGVATTPIKDTICSSDGTCKLVPAGLYHDYIRLFILKNSTADTLNFSQKEYEDIFDAGAREYDPIIGTNNPDLSAFRKAGGKLISTHGMGDATVPAKGTRDYYDKVMALDPDVYDYYRLFLAPGLAHCFGGPGPYPDTTFDSLVNWVENGVAPDTLSATSLGDYPTIKRDLCPYPQKQKFTKSLYGKGKYICK